jgi:hypothetical protein
MATAGAKKKKPKRQALPGGAPVATRRKKTKATARPRAPRAAPKRQPKAKPPCKYGPRGADGYCPKKPASSSRRQTSATRTRVTARTTGSATTQAIDVVTNPRATSAQKTEAVAKVAEAAATSTLKAGAKKVAASGKLAKLKASAVEVARRVPVGGVLAPVLMAASMVRVDPKRFAAAQKTEKAMKAIKADFKRRGQKLTRKDEFTLAQQHMEYFLKNPGA